MFFNFFAPKIPKIPKEEIGFLDKHDPKWESYIQYYEKNCKQSNPIDFSLDILVVADTHNTLSKESTSIIKNIVEDIDYVFLLGDLSDNDIKYLLMVLPKEKIFYIIGNHEEPQMYKKYDLIHVGQQPITLKDNIKIAGIDGSIKYKDTEYVSYSHKDSIELLNNVKAVDILLSHDVPYMSYSKERCHHKGLVGISQFMYKNQVPLNLHGHIHQNKIEILANGAKTINLHGVQILSINKENIKQYCVI